MLSTRVKFAGHGNIVPVRAGVRDRLERTFRFTQSHHEVRGTASLGGILVVLFGWPLVGMIVELYGFVVLSADSSPS